MIKDWMTRANKGENAIFEVSFCEKKSNKMSKLVKILKDTIMMKKLKLRNGSTLTFSHNQLEHLDPFNKGKSLTRIIMSHQYGNISQIAHTSHLFSYFLLINLFYFFFYFQFICWGCTSYLYLTQTYFKTTKSLFYNLFYEVF